MESVSALIKRYNLSPLSVEGGFFRFISTFGDNAGSIYYLITRESFSSLHMLTCDELWFFLEGGRAKQIVADDEKVEYRVLDSNNRNSLVKAGSYQATILEEGEYALFCTIMSPRYSDEMFHLPSDDFLKKHPFLKEYLL